MTSDDKRDLQGTFGAKTNAAVHQDYAADAALSRTLIADLRAMMIKSVTAKRLFEMSDAQGITVRFMRGREETAYVPEFKTVFMTITPHTRATARLALQYAGALREAEQNILGFRRPGLEADDDSWVTQNAVKNVDVIKYMCAIAREIYELNHDNTDFLDSIAAFGHNDIYKALIEKKSDEDLLRLYAQKEHIDVREG